MPEPLRPSSSSLPSTLLTGYPGFLASRLLPLLLQAGHRRVTALVQPHVMHQARQQLDRLEERAPGSGALVELIPGDLTRPDVVEKHQEVGRPSDVFHLAALYDLDVERDAAMAVNVQGTRNLLELAMERGSVERFHHVSTCYVSGRHPGTFREEDLDVGQTFNNHYEESKFLAELQVQRAAAEGLSCTIYRPSIVVGDSRTGETAKYDGPYNLLRWIGAQPLVAFTPRIPGMKGARLNVVPVDFLVAALVALSRRDDTRGRTFHLADHRPLEVRDFIRVSAAALGRKVVPVPLPLGAARRLMHAAGWLPGLPRIPANSLDYLSHPTRYGTEDTLPLLEEEGIEPPRFSDYVDGLVAYLRAHPDSPGG